MYFDPTLPIVLLVVLGVMGLLYVSIPWIIRDDYYEEEAEEPEGDCA